MSDTKLDRHQFKEQLNKVVRFVFDNEESFMNSVWNNKIADCELHEFYMASGRCRIEVLHMTTGQSIADSVGTDQVMDWYEEMNDE